MKNQAPDWVDSYKFFIKETSNEYYNLCMDRWYDAEDDNIWLSFPSAERNKINEDTFIILKKQASSNDAIREEGRYRVIDIQNEAPDFIKTKYEKYGEKACTVAAAPNSTTVEVNITHWKASSFYDSILDGTSSDTVDAVTETGFVGWPLESIVVKLSDILFFSFFR